MFVCMSVCMFTVSLIVVWYWLWFSTIDCGVILIVTRHHWLWCDTDCDSAPLIVVWYWLWFCIIDCCVIQIVILHHWLWCDTDCDSAQLSVMWYWVWFNTIECSVILIVTPKYTRTATRNSGYRYLVAVLPTKTHISQQWGGTRTWDLVLWKADDEFSNR